MRNNTTDLTAWEIEAARRREVVEADFAEAHPSRNGRGADLDLHDGRTGRLRRWLSAVAPANVARTPRPVDRASACHPAIGVIEPGA